MERKFEHKEKEICGLCKKEIDTAKDIWLVVIDFEGSIQKPVKFYHRTCLDNLLQGKFSKFRDTFQDKFSQAVKSVFGKPLVT